MTVALTEKHDNTGDIDLKDAYNIINSKPQTVADLVKRYDNLISYRDWREVFVPRNESLEMKVDLDMDNHFIYNVKKTINIDQTVNKGQMDAELNEKLNTFDAYQRLVHKDQPEVNANFDMNI